MSMRRHTDPGALFPGIKPTARFGQNHSAKKMCIIDLDNRKFNETGQLFGPEAMSWKDKDQVHGLSMGILNHWLYGRLAQSRHVILLTLTLSSDSKNPWLQILLHRH